MRTRKILLGTLAAAAVTAPLALAASPANAATALTNTSFEDATVSFTDGYSVVDAGHQTLTGWTAGGEGVDIVDKALWNADEGSRSIDLNAFNPGSISQTIDTVPGQTYDVSFAMSGNPDANVVPGPKTMNVSAADASAPFTFDTSVEQNTTTDMKWKDQTFSFAATGTSTTLTFTSTTTTEGPSPAGVSAAAGPVIDDVRVETAPNTVKTKVWNTWTGGSVSSTTAPQATDPAWHPTNGDPQSTLHKAENHKVNEPYFVPKGKSGGAWFMWSEVETTA